MELQPFASGDTDYIAKLNQNNTELMNAINALNTQVGSIAGGSALSIGMFLDALFNSADALIGPTSYSPTKSASTLSIAPGGMYLKVQQQVVTLFTTVPLSFLGQLNGTYYIVVDVSGTPSIRTDAALPGTIYSVVWTGSAFGAIVYIAPIFYDTIESTASRKSTVLKTGVETEKIFASLDARLEAGEQKGKDANTKADLALDIAYDLQSAISAPVRKVGVTVDAIGGVKGAIQIDFNGTIIGWSCIADAIGTLQVEVSRKASSAPPAAPQIPNPLTEKISASAPIALAGAQSAARAEAGVGTWTTYVNKWDVLQFTTVAVTGITRATLYLRIFEDLPSPPDVSGSPAEFATFVEEEL